MEEIICLDGWVLVHKKTHEPARYGDQIGGAWSLADGSPPRVHASGIIIGEHPEGIRKEFFPGDFGLEWRSL